MCCQIRPRHAGWGRPAPVGLLGAPWVQQPVSATTIGLPEPVGVGVMADLDAK